MDEARLGSSYRVDPLGELALLEQPHHLKALVSWLFFSVSASDVVS